MLTVSKRSFGWLLLGVLAASLLLGGMAAVTVTAGNTEAIRATQEGNQELLRLIKSCTDPDGECAKQGQERTAAAIADINRVTVYAAACADAPGVQGQAEIYSCVIEKLAEDDRAGGD